MRGRKVRWRLAPSRAYAAAVTWIAPDVERSEDYPARRNEPEREMLRDWLVWHRATLLPKCPGLDATRLAKRAGPPPNLPPLRLVRHIRDSQRGSVPPVLPA